MNGGEECFEIEDDGSREGEAAERLPVDAQVAGGEGEGGGLGCAVVGVRVAGGHEEGLVDFEAPGAALDGFVRGHFGEVANSSRVSSVVVIMGWVGWVGLM